MPIEQRLDYADDVGLPELVEELWKARFFIVGAAVVLAIAGCLTGLLRDKMYEASVTTMSAADDMGSGRSGGLGAIASQLGGLSSLAGLSASGMDSKKEEAIAVLQSDLLTQRYLVENDLLPVLYARKWDAATRQWKTKDPEKIPTPWLANRYFATKVRQLSDEKKTGIITLTIRWSDPVLAAKWANDLVHLTNEYLRNKAIRESQRNIQYLNEQAAKTDVVEARKAIYTLLQDEINKEMVARGRDEYALKVLDPAVVPEKSSSPTALVLALSGAAFGAFAVASIVAGRRIFMGPK